MRAADSQHTDFWKQHFKQHDSYRELTGGGRRKPALPIGGPAVTWHLGFWVPPDLSLDRKTWSKQIEAFICGLYRHLNSLAETNPGFRPRTRSMQSVKGSSARELHLLNNIYSADQYACLREIAGQATRYQTFRVRFLYAGTLVSITIELNDEYFTLATTIDFLGFRPEPSETPDCGMVESLKTAIDRFNYVASVRHHEVKQGVDNKAIHRDAFKEPYHQIYAGIWDVFYDRIFKTPYEAANADGKLGSIFVNVRGFVAPVGAESFIVSPGRYVRNPSAASRIGREVFSPEDALQRADVLLPWLKADQGFTPEDDDTEADRTEPVEFTFTTLADGRGMLGTALGAQLSRKRGAQAPMTYVVLARNQANWQLGRVAHHLHTIISLRVAALYDLQHVINAGVELRKLDLDLERIEVRQLESELNALEERRREREPHEATAARRPKEGQQTRRMELLRLEQELSRIGLQADEKGENVKIAGGLAHRTERSGYYHGQFEELAKEMREGRIEGFPSYNAAVRRRLGGIYELIDMIGSRFARLRQNLSDVNRRLMSSDVLRLQDKITQETGTIEKLQRTGETLFFIFLAPYYFAMFALKAFEDVLPWAKYPILGIAFAAGLIAAFRHYLLAFYSNHIGRHVRRYWRRSRAASIIHAQSISRFVQAVPDRALDVLKGIDAGARKRGTAMWEKARAVWQAFGDWCRRVWPR